MVKNLMKKIASAVMVLALLSTILVGCSQPEAAPKAGEPGKEAPAEKK